MQLLSFHWRHVYLIDFRLLGKQALDTAGANGVSLRSILGSPNVAKVIFDVRTDALALHQAYGIKFAGVHDIQLMDIGTRNQTPRRLGSLARVIEFSRDIDPRQRQICSAAKAAGKKLLDPKVGGSYAVFNVRPLSAAVRNYCVQDVLLLPTLWNEFQRKLGPALFDELLLETVRRINMVQEPGFTREGRNMAQLPKNWNSFPQNPRRTWVDRADQTFVSGCTSLREKIFVLASEAFVSGNKPTTSAVPSGHSSSIAASMGPSTGLRQLSLGKDAI